MLEMNTLALETNVENARLSFRHTHTVSYQGLPSSIYVEMTAIVTATYL